MNTPGAIRTRDHRFRKPVLYPLSYRGDVIDYNNSLAIIAIRC